MSADEQQKPDETTAKASLLELWGSGELGDDVQDPLIVAVVAAIFALLALAAFFLFFAPGV